MDPYIDYEINNTHDLMVAVQDIKTAGYEADVEVQPRNAEGWLIVDVTGSYPGVSGVYGQYWFWSDGKVMQVL